MRTKLFILYGGKSVEHEVSLKTAFTVIASIDADVYEVVPVYITRDGIWCSLGTLRTAIVEQSDLIIEPKHKDAAASIGDVLIHYLSDEAKKVVLPLLHGTNGEDGTVQGLLELLNVPYVGGGVLASAVAFDKAVFKRLIASTGIPQADYISLRCSQWREDGEQVLLNVRERFGFPCYVKPAALGSSVGISRCEDMAQLKKGIEEAFRYDAKIVIEQEIAGREIQVAVMGNEQPLASLPGEFIHGRSFFDFESKYLDKQLRMSIPAQIPDALTKRLREAATLAYETACCTGLARVDFFVQVDGRYFLNEINTLPGFTGTSMYPVMWEKTDGTDYSRLIEKLIDYAVTRHAEKQTIQYSR